MAGDRSDILSRLAEQARRQPRLVGRHGAAFLALKPDITQGLQAGYSMRAVWQLLRGEQKIQMNYDTFRAHCRKAGLSRGRRSARRGDSAAIAEPARRRQPQRSPTPAAPGEFKYNPSSKDAYEDDDED